MTLTEDMSVFFNSSELADDVMYSDNDDNVKYIKAMIDRDTPGQEPYERGTTFATAEIIVKKTDVTDPARKDFFAYDGDIWYRDSDGITHEDDYTYIISLRREAKDTYQIFETASGKVFKTLAGKIYKVKQ